MALSYNLSYQESISVHPTRRQNFAGKPYSNFPNIWEWLIYVYVCLYKLNSVEYLWWWDGKKDDYNPFHHGIFLNAEWCDSVTHYTMRNNLNCEWRGSRLISQLHCCFLAPLCTKTNGGWSRPKFQKMALTSKRCNNSWTDAQGP